MDSFDLDCRYVAHTYRRFPLDIVGGDGSVVYGRDGKTYFDLGGGIAVNLFGWNDLPWKQAVSEQLSHFAHTSNLYYASPVSHLAQALCQRTGMSRVFFSNSGAEANECAIKVARKWAAQEKGAAYQNIITLKNSFHGRTLATLAATGQAVYHQDYHPLPGGFLHATVGDEAELERLARENPCAAIFFECVQGEGGILPIGQAYANALARVAEQYHLLLMVDEVQLGNGRSGALYGYMNYGLSPDVVTTAKALGGGLPLGATMLSARVQDVLQPGDHGSTFGGNPVCCAGALNILSRIDDALLQGVRARSDYLFDALSETNNIRNVSGMGLMLGFETDRPARQFAEELLEAGVLVTTAKNKIRLLPALNIPMEQLKAAVEIIRSRA